ncbi:MAG TPA: Na/Pi cotransporter family protein [Epulopiscium sp.]|nr:Na/Pi cotransporter family protein [Candidatus Epulonipiscium sp.]
MVNAMIASPSIGDVKISVVLGGFGLFLLGFNVEEYGFYLVFIAAIMLLFIKNKKIRNYGQILFALGITFVGLELMGDQLIILQALPQFESFLLKMAENPWLALLAGTIATALINSSSSVIALVQKIYSGGGMTMAVA